MTANRANQRSQSASPAEHGRAYRLNQARLVAAGLFILVLSGCADPLRPLTLTERNNLERRALTTLTQATSDAQHAIAVQAIEALQEVAPRTGVPYFREMLRDEYAGVRFAATMALGTLRIREAEPQIRALADQDDGSVRAAAIMALHKFGDNSRLREFADLLLRHEDKLVRANAALVIGRSGIQESLSLLKQAERLERDESVRLQISEAMVLLGDKEAARKLGLIAMNSSGQKMVFALLSAAEAGMQSLKPLFEQRFDTGEYDEVRLAAAYGLARLGDRSCLEFAVNRLLWPQIDKRSDEPAEQQQARIRIMSALALEAMGDDRALAALDSMVQSEQNPSVQVASARAALRIIRRGSLRMPEEPETTSRGRRSVE